MPMSYDLTISPAAKKNFWKTHNANKGKRLDELTDYFNNLKLDIASISPDRIIEEIEKRSMMTFYDLPFVYENKDPWEGFAKFRKDKSFGIGHGTDMTTGTFHVTAVFGLIEESLKELEEKLGRKINLTLANNIPFGYGMCNLNGETPIVIVGLGGLFGIEAMVSFQALFYMLVKYYHIMSHVWQRYTLIMEGRNSLVHQCGVGMALCSRCMSDWRYLKDFKNQTFEIDAEFSGYMSAVMAVVNLGIHEHPEYNLKVMDLYFGYMVSDMPWYFVTENAVRKYFNYEVKENEDPFGGLTEMFGKANERALMTKPFTYDMNGYVPSYAKNDLMYALISRHKDIADIPINGAFWNVTATLFNRILQGKLFGMVPSAEYMSEHADDFERYAEEHERELGYEYKYEEESE